LDNKDQNSDSEPIPNCQLSSGHFQLKRHQFKSSHILFIDLYFKLGSPGQAWLSGCRERLDRGRTGFDAQTGATGAVIGVRVAVGDRGHLSIIGGRGHLSIVGGSGHLSFAPTLSVTYRGNSSYGIGLDAIVTVQFSHSTYMS
jgi:hypothetical protein